MNKKLETTFDNFIKSLSPKEKKHYDQGREAFILEEIFLAYLEKDYTAVKELAQMISISSNRSLPKPASSFDKLRMCGPEI